MATPVSTRAFDKAAVDRLMDGTVAHMVFTDPHYNVAYGSTKNPRHHIRTIAGDRQDAGEWAGFCTRLAAVLKARCTGDVYDSWPAPALPAARC
jgi:hypothetical protein